LYMSLRFLHGRFVIFFLYFSFFNS